MSLNKSGSPGYDNINAHTIKLICASVAEPMTKIINEMITRSSFPDDMKIARLIPIYKSGDCNLPTNYKAISILPVLSKPVETILRDLMNEFLDANNIINRNQHGFVAGANTTSACVEFININSNVARPTTQNIMHIPRSEKSL